MKSMNRKAAVPARLATEGNNGSTAKYLRMEPDITMRETISAMDYAARLVSRRHRIPMNMARTICELSGLGGVT